MSAPAPVLAESSAELARPVGAKHRIPGLDALRALAVSLVLLYHFGAPVSGPLGVMIFFVLSGFLITGILLQEHHKTGSISLANFYTRRAFRIFPAFYVCWFVSTVLLLVHGIPVHKKEALLSFFYLTDYARALSPESAQTTLHMWICWSLAIEEQFYLLWPALLLFLMRRSKRVAEVVTGIIVLLWIYRAVLFLGFHVSWIYVYNAFDTRVDALLVGCVVSILVHSGQIAPLQRLLIGSRWYVCLPIAVLILGSLADTQHIRPSLGQFVALFTIEPVAVAALLIQIVHWADSGWSFLGNAVVRFVAGISYALYLYHTVVLDEVARLTSWHVHLISGFATVMVAMGSYYLIEQPFLRLRDAGAQRMASKKVRQSVSA